LRCRAGGACSEVEIEAGTSDGTDFRLGSRFLGNQKSEDERCCASIQPRGWGKFRVSGKHPG